MKQAVILAADEGKRLRPFALLSKDTLVVDVVAKDNTFDAMINNIREIKARGSAGYSGFRRKKRGCWRVG